MRKSVVVPYRRKMVPKVVSRWDDRQQELLDRASNPETPPKELASLWTRFCEIRPLKEFVQTMQMALAMNPNIPAPTLRKISSQSWKLHQYVVRNPVLPFLVIEGELYSWDVLVLQCLISAAKSQDNTTLSTAIAAVCDDIVLSVKSELIRSLDDGMKARLTQIKITP